MRTRTPALVALCSVVVLGIGYLLFNDGSRSGDPAVPTALERAGPAAETPGTALSTSGGNAATAQPPAEAERSAVAGTLAPAATPVKVVVSGRLVRRQGGPAAGVELGYLDTSVESLPIPGGVERAGAGQTTTTGADGRFRLEGRAGKAGRLSLVSQDFVLAKVHDGQVQVPASDRDLDIGDVVVIGASSLAGVVRDTAGQSLDGIEVVLAIGGEVALFSQHKTKTDSAGRFAFRGLISGEHHLTTASPRHRPAALTIDLGEEANRDDLVLTLEQGSFIAGRVVDDLGRPLAAINVVAFRKRDLGEQVTVRGISLGESVKTDADGRFNIGGIEDAAVTVRAWGKGYRAVNQPEVARDTQDLLLTLPRSGGIEGFLVDGQGKPIGGSRVRAVGRGVALVPFQESTVTTGADGKFELDGIAPGLVTLEATGSDHRPAEVEVEVHPGQVARNVRLVATSGASVLATVLDTNGQPIEGAEVDVAAGASEAAADGPGRRFRSRRIERRVEADHDHVTIDDGRRTLGSGRTGADGTVLISGLPAGLVTVTARHETLAPAVAVSMTLAASGKGDALLRLRNGGVAEIRVVDAEQVPVAGVAIAVVAVEEGAEEVQATSDREGTTRVGPLLPGRYTAVLQRAPKPIRFGGAQMVLAGNDVSLETSRVPFQIDAGQTAQVVLVQPTLTTLSGSLTNANGPVIGGTVEVLAAEQADLGMPSGDSATTDDEGRFRIDDLPPGRYTLRYSAKRQVMPAEVGLEIAGEREIERHLVLSGGTIKVTVQDGNGEALRRAKVSLRRVAESAGGPRQERRMMIAMFSTLDDDGGQQSMEMGNQQASVQTDDDGIAVLEAVPAGKYVVVIKHPRHVEHEINDVEVGIGAVRELSPARMTAGGTLRGSVNGSDGRVVDLAFVEVTDTSGKSTPGPVTAIQGTFRVPSLAPGRYRVRARPLGPGGDEDWGPSQEAEVEAGKTSDVQLQLK